MNWQAVDIDSVIQIHQTVIKRAKTTSEVRDFSLLYSALERPKATFAGRDLYPTIFLKAAALLQSICLNHPFSDGNKRTAWTITHKFLWDNKYHLHADKKSAVEFIVAVDTQKPDLKFIAAWLKSHSKPI